MKPLTWSLKVRGYRGRDVLGILLALVAGLAGELVMADPLRFLAPQIPMLSTPDWPGSQVTVELQILDGLAWRERRGFLKALGQPVRAEATQVLTWYADPAAAAAAWEQHRNVPDAYEIVAASAGDQVPESVLLCSPAEPMNLRECYYRAHWRHWYSYVNFVGRTPEDLPQAEMQRLAARVDQLLLSAPDRPCQGFFCRDARPPGSTLP